MQGTQGPPDGDSGLGVIMPVFSLQTAKGLEDMEAFVRRSVDAMVFHSNGMSEDETREVSSSIKEHIVETKLARLLPAATAGQETGAVRGGLKVSAPGLRDSTMASFIVEDELRRFTAGKYPERT